MAENSGAIKLAAIGSSATAIAAIAIALSQKEAKAGTQPGQIPPEVMQYLAAISGATGQTVVELIAILETLKKGGSFIQGYPENADVIRSVTVNCAAVATPYQCPELIAPEGFRFAVKSWPNNAVGSLIYVGSTAAECSNPNSCWPLIPNDVYIAGIKNSKDIWVSTTVPGSRVVISIEQRR
jgi:hypothetical protein